MRPALALLLVLFCQPLASLAQSTPKSDTVRDRLWVFAPPADGPRLYYESAGYRGGSRMTPVEGAFWLGVPNLLFITQDWNRPPAMWTEKSWKARTTKEQYAISFEPLKRVQWAAVGSSGRGGLKEVPEIVTLAKNYPNFTGIYLDDFVKDPVKRPDGRKVGKPAMTETELKSMRGLLGQVGRPMEVWTTIYSREFDPKNADFHDCEPPLIESLKHFDVLVFWTWKSEELKDLEKNFALLEAMKPKHCRIALGIYLWDYTGIDPDKKKTDPAYKWGKPVPLDLMEHQCGLGLKWLQEGRVSDLVILGVAGIDQGIPSAPWMRDWIRKHGDERIAR